MTPRTQELIDRIQAEVKSGKIDVVPRSPYVDVSDRGEVVRLPNPVEKTNELLGEGAEVLNKRLASIDTTLAEMKKPHWTVSPMFWIVVASLVVGLFSAVGAWLPVLAMNQPGPENISMPTPAQVLPPQEQLKTQKNTQPKKRAHFI